MSLLSKKTLTFSKRLPGDSEATRANHYKHNRVYKKMHSYKMSTTKLKSPQKLKQVYVSTSSWGLLVSLSQNYLPQILRNPQLVLILELCSFLIQPCKSLNTSPSIVTRTNQPHNHSIYTIHYTYYYTSHALQVLQFLMFVRK
jgi:hypothetical protein